MKDDRGVYYYPFPQNRNVRMYVMEDEEGVVWFRLWNAEDAELWDQHGWVPYEAVQKAQELYQGREFSPERAYDIEIAKALLKG